MYRLADTSSKPPAVTPAAPATPATPVTFESPRRHSASPRTSTADTNVNVNAKVNANVNVNANTNVNANVNANVFEDTLLAEPMDTSPFTSTWPWLAPLGWYDLQLDGSEQDSAQWTSNLHAIGQPPNDASMAFLDAFQSAIGWTATVNGDGDGSASENLLSPSSLYNHSPGLGGDLSESNSSNTTTSTTINNNGPDADIARLSQLSTRLYPLHRSSCALAESAGSLDQSKDRSSACRSPLIDDAAFKSVAVWLVHTSSNPNLLFQTDRRHSTLKATLTGDTLHDAFSASHHLLEILRSLQVDGVPGASASTSTLSTSNSTSSKEAHLDFWANTPQSMSIQDQSTSYFELAKPSSSYARPLSQYSNTVVRHLVIACHTLLLNIYIAVLIALQHEADRSSRLPTSNTDVDICMDPVALADIRLVTVVQLCSFLIKRQYQAVDLYLSPQFPPLPSQQHGLSDSYPPSPPLSTTGNREVMSDLKTEVQQRLVRLRQTLRI